MELHEMQGYVLELSLTLLNIKIQNRIVLLSYYDIHLQGTFRSKYFL